MQRLKFLRHTTPQASSRLSARESIYMCSVVSARCLILARAYPAIAITANKILCRLAPRSLLVCHKTIAQW
jgi:hypothetical protein